MPGRGPIPTRVAGAVLVLLSLSGCYHGPYGTTAHPVFSGAALGAAAGAIGGAVVGRPGAGAAAGAAAGAFLGGAAASAGRYYGHPGPYGPPRYGHRRCPRRYHGPSCGFGFSYRHH